MIDWTTDQKKVINLKNKNILVAAAAGSGKTAVLVERIIKLITDSNNKVDIDHLLIVTFTNAAAAEMRERISQAIENELLKQPDNSHLQKQQTLIHSANITTIHSFCLNVIRNNFNSIDLDPSFRIADETELKLLKSDTIAELLEKHYIQGEDSFYDFIESYSSSKSDKIIEDLILQLYSFSQSYPYSEDWLNSLRKIFDISTQEELENTDCIKFILSYIKQIVLEVDHLIDEAINICNETEGPYTYLDALNDDKILISKLKQASTYKKYSEILTSFKWSSLSSKRPKDISKESKETVKAIRAEIKFNIDNIRKNYFFQPITQMIEDIKNSKPIINVLIDLVIEFSELYSEAKISKNILDFNDLEHKALEILINKNNDTYAPTAVARELSQYYNEIIIDEYQDSNLVQELILNSISKEYIKNPNIFMVGDVKQSIYKFRLARPELFMEKYKTYSKDDKSLYQLVDLHQNFRSRKEILNSVNFVFSQIMDTKLGGIDYNDEAALYKGAKYPENICSNDADLVIVNLSKDVIDDDKEELDYTSKELEAKAIASQIKELINSNFQIYDAKKESYRDIKYSDIVILLRTITNWADVFENVLMSEGIAAHSETSVGYFSTIEVQTVLSLLNIIDNPIQDIPLTAVLKSPIVNLTSEDLATIKNQANNMYTCMIDYIQEGENIELKSKLINFKNQLDNFRSRVPYTSIHELIWQILDETGYYDYITAMPAGQKRKANIDMLVEKAIQFQSTSYKGLFNFIRYINKVIDYEIDFGQASVLSENENVVRIMSIHKSKGLEFPVVFVSGLGKMFNAQDTRNKIVIHSDLGIGTDYIDYRLRVKSPTLLKKIVSKKISIENLGEELRILYVAFTRAKEKLILTGAVKDWDSTLLKLSHTVAQCNLEKLPFSLLSSASTYLDWILPALMRHETFKEILNQYHIYINTINSKYSDAKFNIKIVNLSNIVTDEIQSQTSKETIKDKLKNWDTSLIFDEAIHKKVSQNLNWNYKYKNDTSLHTKITVTELKKLGQNIDSEYSLNLIPSDESTMPKFMKSLVETGGATRGTVVHKLMQYINFKDIHSIKDIEAQIDMLVHLGRIDTEQRNLIDIDSIYKFSYSSIAKRMNKADKVFREKQFIIGVKANEINKNFKSDEIVLVQGIIDVYFEEDNNIVLLDYKTDAMNNRSLFIEKYKTQLDYYQKAIEQTTGKKVNQKLIYSFYLNREIEL